MKLSAFELREIVKAWIAVAIMFSIAQGFDSGVVQTVLFTLFSVGVAFVLHELAHKFVAQRFGLSSEFRASNSSLVIGLLLSFTGFFFVVPGAVYTRGANRDQHGKIALAGPAMNLALAACFLFLSTISASAFISYSLRINAFLGVFNLIPLPPFDGHGVWDWNKTAYGLTALVAIVLAVVALS